MLNAGFIRDFLTRLNKIVSHLYNTALPHIFLLRKLRHSALTQIAMCGLQGHGILTFDVFGLFFGLDGFDLEFFGVVECNVLGLLLVVPSHGQGLSRRPQLRLQSLFLVQQD